MESFFRSPLIHLVILVTLIYPIVSFLALNLLGRGSEVTYWQVYGSIVVSWPLLLLYGSIVRHKHPLRWFGWIALAVGGGWVGWLISIAIIDALQSN